MSESVVRVTHCCNSKSCVCAWLPSGVNRNGVDLGVCSSIAGVIVICLNQVKLPRVQRILSCVVCPPEAHALDVSILKIFSPLRKQYMYDPSSAISQALIAAGSRIQYWPLKKRRVARSHQLLYWKMEARYLLVGHRHHLCTAL